ncbi:MULTISPECIES: hypothetical protein [Pseudomonas]|uniref:Bisphenol A degradation protein n=3 Tax=Pseudomonas TaxID=286 RepID=A7YA99_PSEPU|nr:hypothetical protein [Pseudomonas asiatica]ABU98592.1 bisphenol A degradation protein [Pseudomonas putida]MEE1903943.1 hypothetical protein [Pseudomonas inefficax]MDD2112081.1 hypothetical protein [Pseudomonas asiatica]MEE1909519.1 hypothetical protein [Pseudomonas inefficax]MEE1987332.1 hypothetical protein [Pseudomonas inefficax]
MTHTVRRSLPRLASTTILFPVFTLMLFGLTAPHANAGTLTLVSKETEDHGERRCNVDIPAAGAGKTLKLSLADRGGIGTGNCYDMQPTEIIMQDIPSAAEILLTDDWLCNTKLDGTFYTEDDPEDNKSFVIRLETTRNPSQLPEIGIDRLVEFETGKYIDYVNDRNEKSVGFKLTEKTSNGAGRITRRLSCIEIKISDDDEIPELKAVTLGATKTVTVKEKDSDVTCEKNMVMTRRKHIGDENKDTTYGCTEVKGNGTEKILMKNSFTSASISECGRRKPSSVSAEPPDKNCTEAVTYNKDQVDYIYFTCPTDSVMIGRKHEGDENGYTTYTCAEFYKDEIDNDKKNRMIVEPGEWLDGKLEYQFDFTCGAGEVMIGRTHKSDENGYTRYRCGTLYYPTNTKSQVTP